jgi:chaperonin GroES
MKPYQNRLLVERFEVETKTKGGIHIPEISQKDQVKGKVLAVGEGRFDNNGKRIPMEVRAGNHILFGKHCGIKIEHEGKEYLLLYEDEIFCII